MHVAAALDPIGGLPGVREFPATLVGYTRLLDWMGGFGTIALVGIEGTGSYGAGLARHMAAAGIGVVAVDRSDRQDRRRQGKSDLLTELPDVSAAQAGRLSQWSITEMPGRSGLPGYCSLVASPITTETGHTRRYQSPAFSSLPIFDVSRGGP